ncbi:MAG: homoserine dehydrogenase [Janthinobacterium lividum]
MSESLLANVGAASAKSAQPVCVALLGFGTVGSCFAEVVQTTASDRVRITHIFNRDVERKRRHGKATFVPADAVWTERIEDILNDPQVQVVVELMGGLEPVEGWLTAALKAGKHVVTANKQLIALRGPGLFALAQQRGVQLLYGASVAGGVPVLPGIAQGLSGDRITRLSGIVNGTCNFILSAMENGADYPEMLREAQRLGYAEADPSADVDGHDARAKLCILARLALEAEMDPTDVPAQTISKISAIDFAYARELGCTIRQVSRAQLEERRGKLPDAAAESPSIRARVGPMLVPRNSPVAWSHGTQNMVVTSGQFGGDVVFSGHGAGGHATAVAVLSDVLAIAGGSFPVQRQAQHFTVSDDVLAPHYLRLIVDDKPGIISAISGALAKFGVNIDSILQRRGYPANRLPFVVTTEPCLRSTVDAAVAEMSSMDALVEPPLVLEILVVNDPDTD